MDVKPAPDGGLELGTRVEARLTDQGMFEFIKRVENVRARAIERAREARLGDPLPVYDQPPTSSAVPPSQQSDDLPPGYTL
ncbi:hypothetical protein FRC12_024892 [Ceratobasidium sp. 428]|nr:hypothetical protein FRC12_024892 [Ceratobasidium sp. 428]